MPKYTIDEEWDFDFPLEEIIEANIQKPKLADAFKVVLEKNFIWDLY